MARYVYDYDNRREQCFITFWIFVIMIVLIICGNIKDHMELIEKNDFEKKCNHLCLAKNAQEEQFNQCLHLCMNMFYKK